MYRQLLHQEPDIPLVANPSHEGSGPMTTLEHPATHLRTNKNLNPREGQKRPDGSSDHVPS